MPESYLKQTELDYANYVDSARLEYNGNIVYLIKEYKNGAKYLDQTGIYKYEYLFQKVKGGFQVKSVKFYDTTETLLDTSSFLGYAESITKWSRKNKIKMQAFYDQNGDLIQPDYTPYAKQIQKHKKNGIWIEKYYDSENNRRCGFQGFKIKKQWDTLHIQQGDSMTYFLRIKEIYKLDCNKEIIK